MRIGQYYMEIAKPWQITLQLGIKTCGGRVAIAAILYLFVVIHVGNIFIFCSSSFVILYILPSCLVLLFSLCSMNYLQQRRSELFSSYSAVQPRRADASGPLHVPIAGEIRLRLRLRLRSRS